jgi:hypothetical protein
VIGLNFHHVPVPSFVCKEPNIETDMDGWVAWFDLLKGTLRLIEEELVR